MSNPVYQLLEGTEEEYEGLLKDGEELFALVAPDLNLLAENFIYTKNKARSQLTYEEICIALAIFYAKTDAIKDVMKEKKGSLVN